VKKILLVEDFLITLEMLTEEFKGKGFEVYMAANGKEALTYFDDPTFDVDIVLSDLMMQPVGGAELYETLKVLRPNVKVVLTSFAALPPEFKKKYPECKFIKKTNSMSNYPEKIWEILANKEIPMS
jgi:CheY-like chemotaxis protein